MNVKRGTNIKPCWAFLERDGTGENQGSLPSLPYFSSQHPNSFISPLYSTGSYQHRSLAGHWEETGWVGSGLSDWDVSSLVPTPSPSCHHMLPHCCSATQPSPQLVPAGALPKRALQKTDDGGGAALASAGQPFASSFVCLTVFLWDVKRRSSWAG